MSSAHRDYAFQTPRLQGQRVEGRTSFQSQSFFSQLKKIVWLMLALLTVTLGVLFTLWSFLPNRWLPDYDQNIVLTSENLNEPSNLIFILYYRHKTRQLTLQPVIADQEVTVPSGYGKYPLRSVLPLARLEHKNDSEVRALYSFVLETPIDQVWSTSNAALLKAKTQRQLATAVFMQQIHTTFSLKERVAWMWLLRRNGLPIEQPISLQAWKERAGANRDQSTFRECRVSVINTTKTVGIAGQAEKVLKQAGVTVLRVTDQQTSTTSSKIAYQPNNPSCDALVRYLPSLFPQPIQIELDENVVQRGRSELEIILGEDIAQFLAR